MKSIILAAGRGSRMDPLTNKKPKCLLEIGDKSLLNRQIEILDKKCSDILVVVGYKKEMIINELKGKYLYIENKDYRNTNSIYSLWLARDKFDDDLILINSDIIFDGELIDNFIKEPYNICVALSTRYSLNKGYKVEVSGDTIIKMAMDIPQNNIYGEYAGMVRINKKQIPVFKSYLDKIVKFNRGYWFEDVFSYMAQDGISINYFDVAPFTWHEIDTISEYRSINREFRG